MPRRAPKAPPPPPELEEEDELDEEEEPEPSGQPERVTFVAVPPIFEDTETPDKEPLLEPIVQIAVYRRQDPAGVFSWLTNVAPADIPDESSILSAWGVGVFKLVGKDAANRHRRIRILSVGDWGPKPIATAPAPTHHITPPQRERSGLLDPAVITAFLGFLTTMLGQWQQASRDAVAAQQNSTKEILAVMAQLSSARTGDLEQLLRQALAAKGGGGNSAEHMQDMLAMQQAIFEDLLEKARAGGGGDGIERLIESAMAGWAKGKTDSSSPPGSEANGAPA